MSAIGTKRPLVDVRYSVARPPQTMTLPVIDEVVVQEELPLLSEKLRFTVKKSAQCPLLRENRK